MAKFQELSIDQLQTSGGVLVLNNMLRFLFEKVVADGENRDITFGYGTPESAVTKSVGSLFLRLDGGANTTLYVKESGTGNTGWVAK